MLRPTFRLRTLLLLVAIAAVIISCSHPAVVALRRTAALAELRSEKVLFLPSKTKHISATGIAGAFRRWMGDKDINCIVVPEGGQWSKSREKYLRETFPEATFVHNWQVD